MNRTILKKVAMVGFLGLFSTQTTGCVLLTKLLSRKKRTTKSRRVTKRTIKKRKRVRKAKKPTVTLQDFLANKDCKKVDQLYKESGRRLKRSDRPARYNHYAAELARCDRWDFFFKKVMHYGRTTGLGMLKHMDAKGLPVLAKFKAWMKKGEAWAPEKGRYGYYYNRYNAFAAKHFTNWLLSKPNARKHCRLMKKHYGRFHSSVQSQVLHFFGKANCSFALTMYRQALLSRNIFQRQQACYFLGDKGTRRDISRLYTLARTDSSWTRRGRRRTWTSSVCRSAAGRIKLRLN